MLEGFAPRCRPTQYFPFEVGTSYLIESKTGIYAKALCLARNAHDIRVCYVDHRNQRCFDTIEFRDIWRAVSYLN